VDPSIFGTLLERALDPKERHRLGAHYTPRAYVERLIRPTIEEPLRGDWDLVRAEVRQLVEAGKVAEAQGRVLDFHHQLCRTRVLDPACGTGNFLYVTLDLFKRLESEVLALLAELGYAQIGLEMQHYRVTPEQFLGLEKKPWAKEIAELVLWIGYLQWQVRQTGGPTAVPEPVLRDYGNVQCRDAVLTWDAEELVRDEQGVPVTRWDGETMKPSPVTGEPIPDENARVPVYRYTNPQPAEWPKADFIVGNPPFIGNKRMRLALGDGYVEALRKAHDDVPETADYVMYWWNLAAKRVLSGDTRRFGLITTNSITQTFNRRIVEKRLGGGLTLVFAVPDHPWVEASEGAAVRVAMTSARKGGTSGLLAEVVRESPGEDEVEVVLLETRGTIHSDLRIGAAVAGASLLKANRDLSTQGVIPLGDGFKLSAEDLEALGLEAEGLPAVVRPYLSGRDLVQVATARWVIDFYGLSEGDAKARYPELWQRIFHLVKPERDQNKRETRRKNWWLFGENQPRLRRGVSGLKRFIATIETSKHKPFVFLTSAVCPDHKLYVIASDDAFHLGVLSSRAHGAWALAAGGRLGYGNDPTWTNTTCFLPFPFPTPPPSITQKIRDLGEALDSHRKRQQAAFPSLTLTGIYNVLEKLRSGEPLEAKERVIHEQGLVSVLKEIHDELDAAVFAAYGWPAGLTDEEILERLVALNKERAAEEAEGLVRWLRPEFQNPAGARAEVQGQIEGLEIAPAAPSGKPAARLPWPKNLPDRVVAVRDLLTERGELTTADLATRYKGVRGDEAEKILESLAAVGLAIESVGGGKAARTWRGLR
ncbi:MAG: DNA methyltransferase, partial [Thermoanaerobaculia bacterium]|nr:DNA methyltransferase [Thermoanaerobaculia bacterium]